MSLLLSNLKPWIEQSVFEAIVDDPKKEKPVSKGKIVQLIEHVRRQDDMSLMFSWILSDGKSTIPARASSDCTIEQTPPLQDGTFVKILNWSVVTTTKSGVASSSAPQNASSLRQSGAIQLGLEIRGRIDVLSAQQFPTVGNPIHVQDTVEVRRALESIQYNPETLQQRLPVVLGEEEEEEEDQEETQSQWATQPPSVTSPTNPNLGDPTILDATALNLVAQLAKTPAELLTPTQPPAAGEALGDPTSLPKGTVDAIVQLSSAGKSKERQPQDATALGGGQELFRDQDNGNDQSDGNEEPDAEMDDASDTVEDTEPLGITEMLMTAESTQERDPQVTQQSLFTTPESQGTPSTQRSGDQNTQMTEDVDDPLLEEAGRVTVGEEAADKIIGDESESSGSLDSDPLQEEEEIQDTTPSKPDDNPDEPYVERFRRVRSYLHGLWDQAFGGKRVVQLQPSNER